MMLLLLFLSILSRSAVLGVVSARLPSAAEASDYRSSCICTMQAITAALLCWPERKGRLDFRSWRIYKPQSLSNNSQRAAVLFVLESPSPQTDHRLFISHHVLSGKKGREGPFRPPLSRGGVSPMRGSDLCYSDRPIGGRYG